SRRGTRTWMVRSALLPVKRMPSSSAVTLIPARMGMVVLVETALDTWETASTKAERAMRNFMGNPPHSRIFSNCLKDGIPGRLGGESHIFGDGYIDYLFLSSSRSNRPCEWCG